MEGTGAALSPAVEALWGLRERSRRGGPRPALSVDRIVAAAVGLADEGGLAALSMARLAEKLGFTTMSLYRHVASKEELLLLALDAAIGVPPEPEPDAGWRAGMQRWAESLAGMYRRHLWTLDLPISSLPAGPNQLLWFDRGLAALAATRLTEAEKASSVLLVASYVRTNSQLAAEFVRAADGRGEEHAWAQVLTAVISAAPDRFPAVARAAAAGAFGPGDGQDAGDGRDAGDYPDDEFDFGLQRVLDGLEALDRSRA